MSKKKNENSRQSFINRTIKIFTLLMGLVIFIVFFFIYTPLKNELEHSLLENFRQISNTKYLSLKNNINMNFKNALALSEEEKMYKEIIKYHNKEINYDKLKENTERTYINSLQTLEYLSKAQRYVDGNCVVNWDPDKEIDCSISQSDFYSKEQYYQVIINEGEEYFVIYSPIKLPNKEVIGYDQLFFNIKEIVGAISVKEIDTTLMSRKDVIGLIDDSDELERGAMSEAFYLDGYFYHSYYMNNNVDFVVKQHKKDLLKPIYYLDKYVMYIGLIVLIVYTIIIYLSLVRYASKELSANYILLNKARTEADTDTLTKAYSRRYGENQLLKSFSVYTEIKESPAIILFDIDGLKKVNDTYGHEVGDQLIYTIADTIMKNIRGNDVLIRWGGDEFIGIFNYLDKNDALALCAKLLKKVSNILIETDLGPIRPTISIGISYFREKDHNYKQVVKRADIAMYRSKNQGKNRVNME